MVPKLSITLLIGIRVLCNAGCEVIFTKPSCDVIYDEKIILRGNKDPCTDLWTLPMNATNERVKTTNNDAKGTQGPHVCRQVEMLEVQSTSIPKTSSLSCPKIDSTQHSH
jgi:hypothetical protein